MRPPTDSTFRRSLLNITERSRFSLSAASPSEEDISVVIDISLEVAERTSSSGLNVESPSLSENS